MTADFDRRKRELIAIIGRDRARADEIEKAIRQGAWEPHPVLGSDPRWWYQPVNKRDKKVAKSLASAVKRLEWTLGRADEHKRGVMDRATRNERFAEWKVQLPHWRECFEAFAGVAKPDVGDSFFPRGPIWPLGRPKPSAEKFARKRRAVAAAARLLESHGLRLTVTRKSETRKASVFCRVSAILYGDKSTDLYHQCRTFIKKTRNKGSK